MKSKKIRNNEMFTKWESEWSYRKLATFYGLSVRAIWEIIKIKKNPKKCPSPAAAPAKRKRIRQNHPIHQRIQNRNRPSNDQITKSHPKRWLFVILKHF
jgi:hypothetical protein